MPRSDAVERALSVRDFVSALGERLRLRVFGAEGSLERSITTPEIQKPGLVLTGFTEFYHPERLQFLGRSEIRFIREAGDRAPGICRGLCADGVPALLVTRGLDPPRALLDAADANSVPILVTPLDTAEAISIVLHHLAVRLAPRVRVHGVLVDVYGLGILILGESGIGKSESALELIARGHRLVADDIVEIRLIEDQLVGGAPQLSRDHMEVRGLGIMNAFEMFGITAIRESIRVEQVVRLIRFDPRRSFDRLGTRSSTWKALGHELSLYEIPVAPGRNVGVLLEVAARRLLLLRHGFDPARSIVERVSDSITRNDDEDTP